MNQDKPINGGRNLTIFGIAAIIIAFISAGVSLYIYTVTGDIYLDRSRPGFISEGSDSKPDQKPEADITFPADGTVTKKDLDEYLTDLDILIQEIISDPDAFSSSALSDEALNITGSVDF